MSRFLILILGTVIHRPYVYVFFAFFLFFAWKHLRARGTVIWTLLAYLVAFGSEYSSTRNGFPFGIYRYFDEMRAQELWISNIPFWDPLSFVFLSYFCWRLAGSIRPEPDSLMKPTTALLAGVLMMLLDVVIDPITLLGDRWFLGRVYDYPTGGSYFGVTLSNFAGWFFVGTAIPLLYRQIGRLRDPFQMRLPSAPSDIGVFGVYAGVFIFNLGITAWIGEWTLFWASSLVATVTLAICLQLRLRAQRSRRRAAT